MEVSDSSGGLSWNSSANALTVQCWFKISIPSGTNLTENMTILADRRTGTQANPHAFLIQYNLQTGNVEFTARGSGAFTNALIARPYLDRWYHVAVVRQGENFTGYVDGREVFNVPSPQTVGNASNTDGISIGGWAGGRFFYGEVQEISIRQEFLDRNFINEFMFSDQPTNDTNLKGYFKLGYSTNLAERLRNFAPAPVPTGTETATATGTVEFEEASQSGEQSKFDSLRNGGRDALTPLSGAFSWRQTALARPTPGIAFDFQFGYSSANAFGGFKLGNADPYAAGALGPGWRHTFETRVIPSQDFLPVGSIATIGLMNWDGTIETWDGETNEFGVLTGSYSTRHGEYRGELYFTNSFCEWRTPERLVYRFRQPDSSPLTQRGLLVDIRDFNGNTVQLLRNTSGVITQIVDSVAGSYQFNYHAGLLTNASFNQWQVNFAYDATNRLISKTLTNTANLYSAVNTTWQFQYGTNGLLARVIDPRGNTSVFVQYDQYGRQTNQVDALGRAAATRYGVPGKRQITRIDLGTNSWIETYDRKGRILAQQDPLTNVTHYAYDTNGNRISITEPLGWTTTFGYDDRANVIARTNALGEITRWTIHPFFNKATQEINPLNWTNGYAYDAAGNLTNHSDALGSLVRYTYTTNGLVLTSTDANGNLSQFAYDTNGFLIARTDPANHTWHYTVNDVGWKHTEINPLNDTTYFTYDLNGNPVQVTDPLNRAFTRQWDANGNLVAQSDGKSQFTRHAYDSANQRIATTNRAGHVWQYTFTARGKPERATDPLGHSTTNFYDDANRLIRIAAPQNHSITNQYDANGNLIALFDPLGQRWSKTHDRLNRAIAETDPLGNTRQTTFDAAGRISEIITPNGFPSLHFYDGRGRLTQWRDAEGFDWRYDYDGNSNITNITDALGGHYVMAYGPRNERLLERNQDNFEWQYSYDQLLRLKAQRDPNQTLRTRNYDAAGRVRLFTLSTGREDTYEYDDNDNPRVIVRRVNGVAAASTSLTYDALDRVTRVVDPHGQPVEYGFDALGRVTSLTYPGNRTLTNRYDALGRLTNQVDWAGGQMHYAYDHASRLTRRVYPNGIVQTNTFDTAGRITGLSHSTLNSQLATNTIAIALAYAYDKNGNKIGGGERGTLEWPLPTLTDESASYTASGRLQTRVAKPTPPNTIPSPGGEGQGESETFSYAYDPSGNVTNATGGGQTWQLTYDEDNRTTSIHWDAGITAKVITNRYDVLGRRIAKRVDGVETRYVLDLSGNMERILCDATASGQITAWYVHGPDLTYRVDATNGLLCYHADAQANIIALTDGRTNLVAQYAYTPYGRSLGSSIQILASSNPYTFVGSQGVTEESDIPGLYFMRARYYSADAGVFLSTDPVKKIGPGWKPVAYGYVTGNPLRYIDPQGLFAIFLGGMGNLIATVGLGAEVSGASGWIIETRALFRGDFANAFGVYESIGLGVSAGAKAGAEAGAEFGVEWGGGYGVKSYQGVGGYAGASAALIGGGSLNASFKPDTLKPTGLTLSLGGGLTGGAEVHAGLSKTYVQSSGNIAGGMSGVPQGGGSSSGGKAPTTSQSSGSSGSPSGNTAAAGAFGNLMTAISQTPTAQSSSRSGSTSGGSGGQLGINLSSGSSTTTAGSTPAVSPSVSGGSSSGSSSSSSSSGNIFSRGWSWFTGLFR